MEEYSAFWLSQFFGRLHPLLVHFPIGLLVVALFLEMLTVGNKRPGLREGINWLVYLGSISALLSAILGLVLFWADDYQGPLVDRHLIFGISTVVMGLLTAWQLRVGQKNDYRNLLPYRWLLGLTVVSLTVAGHLGATLTHGEDFLSSTFPWNESEYAEGNANELLAELAPISDTDSLSLHQQDRLNLEVRGIFAHHCYKCHSELKQKGELMLETQEGVMKGGESGKIIVLGDAQNSEIIRRLKLPRSDEEAMPGKGKALAPEEIALISLWIDQGAHWADESLKIFPEAPLALSKPDLPRNNKHSHPVDRLIDAYFEKHQQSWPDPVDDRTFIRRAYLDVIGLLPRPEQVQAFVDDTAADKRIALVNRLLSDEKNYAQHWLSFWNDLLRNDYSGTGFITGGRKQITDWLYEALLHNKPYHRMVKELTNPDEASEGFVKGIEWRGVVNSSQRTEMQAAQNISQSLLGVNLKCASCHNSFVSNLTLEQSYGFANVFSDTTLEIHRCDKPTGQNSQVAFLYPELGTIEAETVKEKLEQLSELMVKPENGRLYRTIVNRLWDRIMGRGLVVPLDEMDQSPWNADLLDWLAADLIDHEYDLKHTLATILTSRAYQLPSVTYDQVSALRAEDYVFTGPVRKRLSAEQFADAVSQVITPLYYSMAYDPEPTPLTASWIWMREQEVDRDVLPQPGTRYFRRQFRIPDTKKVEEAEALLTADHAFTLYLNGTQAAEGSDWRKAQRAKLGHLLRTGTNQIAVVGQNEGTIRNPAGLLFALRVRYQDGSEELIYSDNQWKATDTPPAERWTQADFDDSTWSAVKEYGTNAGKSYWGTLSSFRFAQQDSTSFVRAALVQQNSFLKALGRPTRENVTTSRDNQATLLQALELTNGDFFNKALEEGAASWLAQYGSDSETLVDQLYLESFGRWPTSDEKGLLTDALGPSPGPTAVQDLLWATVLLPEFQFIY